MPPMAPVNPFAINAQQRAAVLAQAVNMMQPIATGSIDPTQQTQIQIVPRNVGLIKRFLVRISAQFNNTDGANNAAITDFGVANLLSRVTFTDLQNNVRIDTTGYHLAALAAAKYHGGLGEVLSTVIAGQKYGDNFGVIKAPATINSNANGTIQFVYEVPLAYSDDDLRGAVYAGVINASQNLTLYLNTTPSVAANTDSTNAIYKGIASSSLTNVSYEVYQEYLDQLPVSKNGVVLPVTDISTVYDIKKTAFSGMVVGNDFQIPYANYRSFLSTLLVYNHDSSADAGRVGGSDVNYFALQSANFTNIWKKTPVIAALDVRKHLKMDLPNGVYYFGSRRAPISTNTYGNMQLVLNPQTAATSAYAQVCWESFAIINTLNSAGSLAG